MKKNKWITPLILLVIFIGLAVYVFKFERGEAPKEKQVFRFRKEDVTRLQIKYDETTLVCSKSGDEWKINQPIQTYGSKDEIERLIERIATLQAQRFISKQVKLSDADTGLDKPKVEISLWLKGRSQPETLSFGGETPISSNVYARRGSNGTIFTVYSSLPDTFKKKPEDLRDKKILAFDKDNIEKLQLAYANRQIVAEKQKAGDKNEWRLVQPIQAKADSGSVNDVLFNLQGYEVKNWVETKPTDLSKYGLDKPQITVTLTAKDGKQETLTLGKKKAGTDEVFARNPARGEVVTLAAKALDELTKQPFDLQDKSLLSFKRDDIDEVEVARGRTKIVCTKSGKGVDAKWKIILPEEAEADKWKVDDILWDMEDLEAKKFVEEAATNLAKYGLDSPRASVRLSGKGKTYSVLFGEQAENDSIYAKTNQSPRVVLVDKSALDNLPKSADDLKKKEKKENTKGD